MLKQHESKRTGIMKNLILVELVTYWLHANIIFAVLLQQLATSQFLYCGSLAVDVTVNLCYCHIYRGRSKQWDAVDGVCKHALKLRKTVYFEVYYMGFVVL